MAKTVITYGTFDMFHIGHLKLLRRLSEMGDRVIVAVSTDEFNELKGKKTLIPYDQRAAIVGAIDCVDLVIPEESWEQKVTDIQKYDVDIFAIGNDWKGEFDFLEKLCEVVYLPRTKNISTTDLKKSLTRFLSISQNDLKQAFDVLELLRRDLS
ncbi:adenylyltransferase/cytidyltransferase family protein [Halopseudomonas pertucinogena]|uniref:Glycerol-3-phosphate cytidylyltransferase n=1 Tax=Halopseudomonas pertucinogena TaxID=86175 RepID=A0ABQ2CIL9_9GAMM|nr:adenylyltransferase/cytidyltransferase family protein [Halopseudomonas pertucinogena]GGI90941.1 glycerol-3-phosphate cytidylyltransferase [Halopseudomonas pertucinogena]